MNRDKKGTSEPVLQLPPASNANDNSNGPRGVSANLILTLKRTQQTVGDSINAKPQGAQVGKKKKNQ